MGFFIPPVREATLSIPTDFLRPVIIGVLPSIQGSRSEVSGVTNRSLVSISDGELIFREYFGRSLCGVESAKEFLRCDLVDRTSGLAMISSESKLRFRRLSVALCFPCCESILFVRRFNRSTEEIRLPPKLPLRRTGPDSNESCCGCELPMLPLR